MNLEVSKKIFSAIQFDLIPQLFPKNIYLQSLCLQDGRLSFTQTGFNNGLDMSLQQQFVSGDGGGGNPPFLGKHQPPSFSIGQSTSSHMGQHSSSTAFPHPGTSWEPSGMKLFNVQPVTPFSSERVSGANQHLKIQMSQANRASSSVSSCPHPQEFKNSNVLSGIAAETQSKLLALKQQHVNQRLQLCRQKRTSTSLRDLAGIRMPAGDFSVTPVPLRNDAVHENEEEDDGEGMEREEHSGTTCQMVDGRKFERWWTR
jgi:hypothetical protein